MAQYKGRELSDEPETLQIFLYVIMDSYLKISRPTDKISGSNQSADLTDLSTDHSPNPAVQENIIADPERGTLNLLESAITFSCPAGLGSGDLS